MTCRDFEAVLESYLAEPEASEFERAREHLRDCDGCRELVELARLASAEPSRAPIEPPADLVANVLRETTGPSCGAAEARLCDHLDGQLNAAESELVERHLTSCGECRALESALGSLALDLPTLAEIPPDERFTADVLRATLPLGVRFERWRQQVWPRWVARPRFAAEAAYALTLVLVLIFSVPGTPLEAMPRAAVEVARATPTAAVGEGLERLETTATTRLRKLTESESARALSGAFKQTLDYGTRGWKRFSAAAEAAPGWAGERMRTLWGWLASLLEKADDDNATADPESDKEN